jgi:hypothetical protein
LALLLPNSVGRSSTRRAPALVGALLFHSAPGHASKPHMTAEGSHAIISAGDPLLQDRERSFAIASTISGKRYVNHFPGELSEPNPLGLFPRDNSEPVVLDLDRATPARRAAALQMWAAALASLCQEDITAFASGRHSLDALVRRYIHQNLFTVSLCCLMY